LLISNYGLLSVKIVVLRLWQAVVLRLRLGNRLKWVLMTRNQIQFSDVVLFFMLLMY